MARSPSSSAQAARQALADQLKEIRCEAGLTAKALAAEAGWDRTKVSQIEHARRPPSIEDVRTWCRVCGVEDQADDLVTSLRAAEGMWVEWRRMERGGLKRAQESVLPLFERTRMFRSYSSWLLPGLLQTEDYTRAVLNAVRRRRQLVDDVEAAVAVRMERKELLRRSGRTFAFLVEESVLRTGIGGVDVMREQLAHLGETASLPSVSLGIVPMNPDRETRPVEDFWIYDAEQVGVELVSGYLTITNPREIAMYGQVFGALADEAVYGVQARRLMRDALGSLNDEK
ncbi:helix-turn-helix domain-containing protein [Actinomadura chibensis]|uniref:Helix-turn-helix transcriptional regulator n=1 Tax=Actinomadura chibensis TaxID=392828 RepID=A0A5D0N8Z9_9ACTN|nr:helix-turn-helix transcriptional regulator [Actinomadura chibensis]TYB40791.1 helix-turn-helix transcriptional regulator [Actinomadura chibensis]